MNWSLFSKDWDSTKRANMVLLGVVALLVFSNVFLAGRLASERHTVILVPPKLNHRVSIGYASANAAFYKTWALYAAELAGNLTPDDAHFVSASLRKIVSPSIYQSLHNSIYAEKDQELQYHVVTTFQANSIIWQPETSTAFVTGYLHQVTPDGKYTSGSVQTYQMNFIVKQDQPVITAFMGYPGIPHTLLWMKAHKSVVPIKKANP